MNTIALALSMAEAAIPLRDGETIRCFQNALRDAVKGWAHAQFDSQFGANDDGEPILRVSFVDAASSSAIVNVWTWTAPEVDTYIEVSYTRAADGSFNFGTWSEVQRQVIYVPAPEGQRQLQGEAASALRLAANAEVRGDSKDEPPLDGAVAEHVASEAGCAVSIVVEREGTLFQVGSGASMLAAVEALAADARLAFPSERASIDRRKAALESAIEGTLFRGGTDANKTKAAKALHALKLV